MEKGPVTHRETLLVELDEELLKGGVILSEWVAWIVQSFDDAFLARADVAAILTAMAAVETQLRSEASSSHANQLRLVELINGTPMDADLKSDLHLLRRYRNRWVHVDDPWNDADLLTNPQVGEAELDQMATLAARTLRRVLYLDQWI